MLRCHVYVYRCPTSHTPLFVGATSSSLRRRDLRHRCSRLTSFDRLYRRKGQFTLGLLESRTFPATQDAAARLWMRGQHAAWVLRLQTHRGLGLNHQASSWAQSARL